jgi:CPA2 family monovalent cation:H+ antiporter-2
MKTLQHILAATDLSALSLRALERATLLARGCGARLTVVHALGLDALGPLRNLLGEQAEEVTRKALAHQHERLQALVAEHAQGPSATVRVEPGLAASAVPACALAEGADLVVVGAKGEGNLRRYLIGSTASHLLRRSPCPVLVVKKAPRAAYRRALIPVDFSPASALSIRLVRELAPTAHLLLLHVFELPFEGMLQYAGVSADQLQRLRDEARERALRALHTLASEAGLARSDYVAVVEHGDAMRHVLEQEAHARCDLIAMGKHGTHVTEELLLGSVTQRVLSEAHADLLVVVDRRAPAPTLA